MHSTTTKFTWLSIFCLALILCYQTPLQAQKKKNKQNTTDYQAKPAGYDEALFNALEWRSIGPFRGGRSAAATGVPGKPNLYYMGATGGGVWRTTDGD